MKTVLPFPPLGEAQARRMEYAFATMKKKPTPIALKRLTAGEQSALSLILNWHAQHKTFPSLRAMASQAGYKHQQASTYRKALASKGWIKLAPDGTILTAVQPLEAYKTVKGVDPSNPPT